MDLEIRLGALASVPRKLWDNMRQYCLIRTKGEEVPKFHGETVQLLHTYLSLLHTSLNNSRSGELVALLGRSSCHSGAVAAKD